MSEENNSENKTTKEKSSKAKSLAVAEVRDSEKQVISAVERQLDKTNSKNKDEKMAIIQPLIKEESSIPYLYCDSAIKKEDGSGGSNVTVGVGFMIPNENAMKVLNFHKSEKDFTLASDEEKVAAFKKILGKGATPESKTFAETCSAQNDRKTKWTAINYSETTTLRLTPESQAFLLIKKVEETENDLKRIFSKDQYEAFPIEVKTALVDMHYNLGPGQDGKDGKEPTKFRKYVSFIAAVKKSDWETAAKECRRDVRREDKHPGIKARNDRTAQLFHSAAAKKFGLPGLPGFKPLGPIKKDGSF